MEEIKKAVKQSIFKYLDRMSEGLVPKINFFKYTKKGLSKKDIIEIIVDYALESDLENLENLDRNLFFDTENLNLLLEDSDKREKVIKLFQKFYSIYNLSFEIYELLLLSNFNLYFLIGLESFYDFTNFSNSKFDLLLSYITNIGSWNESSVKRFFIYFFNNDAYIVEFNREIRKYFKKMGETIQRFLIFKTNFSEYLGHNTIITFLSDETISDVVKKKLIEKANLKDEDIDSVAKVYINIPEEYRKMLFPSEREFFTWLGDSQEYDTIFTILDDLFSPENVGKFFRYNPNWSSHIDTEDGKVKLKYQIRGVPDFVKDSIVLAMVEEVQFDGEDVEKMFADYRDSHSVWVRYYVDEELYDHSMSWDYNPATSTIKEYYWDDLTPENLNKIKEILKKNNPDLDLDDEDAVQEAAFEDGEIRSTLHSAAADGERNGDESKLIEDIKEGIDELFGKGNWRHTEPGVIKAKVDISQFDVDNIIDAFNDCGEWHIRCIFFTIRKEAFSSKDKPSLPEYRYGIQGDFDKVAFNDYIEGNL